MYEAYYGLTAKPFQLNPDPSFYFDSTQHRRARAYLEYGVHQNEGFIVVTGEIGAGKTTIVRGLLEALDKEKVIAAQLVSTQLDADDMLRMVAAAFGVHSKGGEKADLLLSLEAFLVDVARQGKRCLLIVDEAQNLTPRAVEELRMLSNFQFESHALLQSFLVGQPEFRMILLSPQMEQLRQRVIAACHIGPLSAIETQEYIQHRITCAGSTGDPQFEGAAFAAIHRASAGIPRRINGICDRLLLAGFLADKKIFSKEDVDDVASEINDSAFMTGVAGVTDTSTPSNTAALSAPGAFADDFSAIDFGELTLDASVAAETDRLLNDMNKRRVVDRLVRVERSLLRLEQSNSLILRTLQKLIEKIRPSSDKNTVKQ
ncbi:MAG: XrtA-associated ATPase [Rugosibacter sp.]|jgi:putative secretion ATPase (PEP-CTERM system associated)|nr:XrtA-associated ATPase [Rugosibacter sp.]MDO9271874.1 XrtA-associated ATPase [Rugosibacter sp.]